MRVIGYGLRAIDLVTEWSGWLAALLVIPLIVTQVYEVILRYVFNSPTAWAFEIARYLGGTLFVLGLAWVLKHKAHIRMDLIYRNFSPRRQAIIDIVLTLIIFFPLWILALDRMVDWLWLSWATHERSSDSYWRPIIYPFKTMMPVAFLLLLLAMVADFIRNLGTVFKGEKPCWM
ncbi:MAG TPA: TRAP transporter small permease subunit [Dehalococcoidia bacterium]|nr:TRAP transporter small permease subunit [Dehalococcoidia bacterium]